MNGFNFSWGELSNDVKEKIQNLVAGTKGAFASLAVAASLTASCDDVDERIEEFVYNDDVDDIDSEIMSNPLQFAQVCSYIYICICVCTVL